MAAPDGAAAAAAAAAVGKPRSLLYLADPSLWNAEELEHRQRAASSFRKYCTGETDRLELDWCELHSLPSEVFELYDLEVLDVAGNQLSEIPLEISGLVNLKKLFWGSSGLRNLSGTVLTTLPNLRVLDVSSNGFVTFPPELLELRYLEKLNVSYNDLSVMPPGLSRLTSLRRLYMRNNLLSSLPEELFELRNLEQLGLSYNHLSVVPPGVSRLTNLCKLGWSHNNLRELPGDVLAALPNLRVLDVEDNELSSLPSELFELHHLEGLYVGYNRLPVIPSELARLTNLRVLDWIANELRELPGDVLAALPALEALNVQNNALASLPSELFKLQHLELLDLINCGVDDGLPTELWKMTTLISLYIPECGLTEIPRAVGNLTRLEHLDIRDNPLKELPAELGLLPALKMLDARGTDLEDATEKHLADTFDNVLLREHLRERARRELAGRLTKRASTTTADSEAGAGTSSKQEMSD